MCLLKELSSYIVHIILGADTRNRTTTRHWTCWSPTGSSLPLVVSTISPPKTPQCSYRPENWHSGLALPLFSSSSPSVTASLICWVVSAAALQAPSALFPNSISHFLCLLSAFSGLLSHDTRHSTSSILINVEGFLFSFLHPLPRWIIRCPWSYRPSWVVPTLCYCITALENFQVHHANYTSGRAFIYKVIAPKKGKKRKRKPEYIIQNSLYATRGLPNEKSVSSPYGPTTRETDNRAMLSWKTEASPLLVQNQWRKMLLRRVSWCAERNRRWALCWGSSSSFSLARKLLAFFSLSPVLAASGSLKHSWRRYI